MRIAIKNITIKEMIELPSEVTRGKASIPAPIAEPMMRKMDPINLARNIELSIKKHFLSYTKI
jgi:hypothetical protein